MALKGATNTTSTKRNAPPPSGSAASQKAQSKRARRQARDAKSVQAAIRTLDAQEEEHQPAPVELTFEDIILGLSLPEVRAAAPPSQFNLPSKVPVHVS